MISCDRDLIRGCKVRVNDSWNDGQRTQQGDALKHSVNADVKDKSLQI